VVYIVKAESFYKVRALRDLKDMLSQSCSLFAENTAFLLKNGEGGYDRVTYRRFGEDVEAAGTAMLKLGLKNRFIAVIGENRYEWCVTYLSVVNGVGTVVPLDKELPLGELENLLLKCEATAVVFSGKFRDRMKTLAGSLPDVKYFIDMDLEQDEDGLLSFGRLLDAGRALVKAGESGFRALKVNPDNMCTLLYTSGTTDLAKGVMLSHGNICTNLTSVCSTVLINESDLSLSILPLHHTYECTLGFFAMIYNGGSIAFNEGLKHIADNFKQASPTVMITVPLILENMYKKIMNHTGKTAFSRFKFNAALVLTNLLFTFFKVDIRKRVFRPVHENFGGRMRIIIAGAAAVNPEVSRCFRRLGIAVLQGYGLTECAPLVAGNRDRRFRDDAAGLPIPGVKIRILNPDENGEGEIIVKGGNVMLGYYRNEQATKACMSEGWFHTGDSGSIDKKGFLYITGRLKNVIITKNGKNIFPEEVETYINRSPFVKDSLVWGKYDHLTGNTVVCAQILPNSEAISEKLKGISFSGQEMMKLISQAVKNANTEMPLYKHIREYSIRETEFIKTTTQKIKRYLENPVKTEFS
jgi:long-chain acyl-CoA synthetase